MRRFLLWWLVIGVTMVVALGVAALASVAAEWIGHAASPWVGALVIGLVCSAIAAGIMASAFKPTPPWMRALIARLS